MRELGRKWSEKTGVRVDWNGLVDDWIRSHDKRMMAIRGGGAPWVSYHEIYREDLPRLLHAYTRSPHNYTAAEQAEIGHFWDHLQPRPDLRPGLDALRGHFQLATLSNGDTDNLQALSRSSGIRWDFYFSADQVHAFKPAQAYYRYAAEHLHAQPPELMMVASHLYDLEAAHTYGWQTALVDRPGETPPGPHDHFDYVVPDLNALAKKLLAR